MHRRLILAVAATLILGGAAIADPIEGRWKTAVGETVVIAPCPGGFCITVKTGKFAGKAIGKMSANSDNRYTGSITDPSDDKTYSGSGSLSGSTLSMTGCALKVFCKTQKWSRL